MGPMAPFRCGGGVVTGGAQRHGSPAQNRSAASTTTRVDDSTEMTTDSVPSGRSSAAVALELDGLAAEAHEHLAGAAGADRRHDPGVLADERRRGRRGIGRAVPQRLGELVREPAEAEAAGDADRHGAGRRQVERLLG